MEIRVYICLIYKFLLIPGLVAKTFSLNEAIAAEERSKATVKTPKLSDTFLKPDRYLQLGLKSPNIREFSKTLSSSILSPFKYRKPFQIKSPLRPKTLKRPQKDLRFINQNKYAKIELDNDEEINQNYIPLFKSLSIILDNVLDSDSGETFVTRNKYKRNPTNTFQSNDVVCNCAIKTTTESYLSESYEKAASSDTIISPGVEIEATSPSITTSKAHHIANDNIRDLGRNKNISILPPRNTSSVRRNIDGFNERRSSSYIRNDKGSVTGNNGNNEHDSGVENVQPYTKNREENTNSDTQHSSSSHEPRGIRPDGSNTRDTDGKGNKFNEDVYAPHDSIEGNLFGHKGKNKLQNRGIETKNPILLSKSPTRLQRLEPQKTEIIQTKEKDFAAIERYITSAKRISNRNSENSSDYTKSRRANETLTLNKKESPHNKVVMIFDGYSVARDVNGENKMSEKAIEIHT